MESGVPGHSFCEAQWHRKEFVMYSVSEYWFRAIPLPELSLSLPSECLPKFDFWNHSTDICSPIEALHIDLDSSNLSSLCVALFRCTFSHELTFVAITPPTT